MNLRGIAKTISSQTLPTAFVDLGAFDRNTAALVARAGGKPIRLATKSLRCLPLIRRVLKNPGFKGLLTYSARETVELSRAGLDDLVLAYPSLETAPLKDLAREIGAGKNITVMVDHPDQLKFLNALAGEAGVKFPVALDIDVSSRWPGLNFGVYRSFVHLDSQLETFMRELDSCSHLRLRGLMGYEAQFAGVPNQSALVKLLQKKSAREVYGFRGRCVARLRESGHTLEFVNGGGTGSLEFTANDPSVTELAAGSGLYSPTLFDQYAQFKHEPALGFALRVTRQPLSNIVTCAGGGYIASGQTGKNRMPAPIYPEGLEFFTHEGAGEVQTPLKVTGTCPKIGDVVLFRPAKAGEPLERFNQVLLFEGDRIVETVSTFRGQGWNFG